MRLIAGLQCLSAKEHEVRERAKLVTEPDCAALCVFCLGRMDAKRRVGPPRPSSARSRPSSASALR